MSSELGVLGSLYRTGNTDRVAYPAFVRDVFARRAAATAPSARPSLQSSATSFDALIDDARLRGEADEVVCVCAGCRTSPMFA